jgi:hypothetical protein
MSKPFSPLIRKKTRKIYCSGGILQLTCLAIPKSASLTTPEESTSKLAPLISLYEYMKRKCHHMAQIQNQMVISGKERNENIHSFKNICTNIR